MQPLTVVVATDNHYIILLAALIKSIETNLSVDKKIDIYIIEDNVSQTNKTKLQQSINTNITTLIWKDMAGVIPEGIKLPLDRSSYPLNIYMPGCFSKLFCQVGNEGAIQGNFIFPATSPSWRAAATSLSALFGFTRRLWRAARARARTRQWCLTHAIFFIPIFFQGRVRFAWD